MSFQDYWRVIRARWRWGLGGLAIGIVGAVLSIFLATPQYEASNTLYVVAQGADTTALAYQGSLLSEQRISSYIELLTGKEVADATSASLGGQLSPDELQRSISATSETDNILITVSARNPNPELARRIANNASQAFIQLAGSLETLPNSNIPPSVIVRQAERTTVSSSPVVPDVPLSLALGILIGALLGLLAAFGRHFTDRTFKDGQVCADVVDVSNLGYIPYKSGNKSCPLVSDANDSAFAEAFRRIRTNLQFVDFSDKRRVLAVTSCGPGEGKSTSAANIALSLAVAGNRVILLDGDMRRPSLHSITGLDQMVGLSTILSSRVRANDALQSWNHKNLWVVTSGQLPPNPAELLGSERMSRCLSEFKEMVDYVIVDTPPSLPVADSAAVSVHCDAVLLVCRYSSTRREQIEEVARSLRAVQATISGTILSMVPSRGSGYYTKYSSYPTRPA